jgi:sulfatase modifying factor 1
MCAPGQTQCSGNGSFRACAADGTFGAPSACASAKPYCYSNVCNAEPPSCGGLSANCGPAANESCCASPPVTGGTFNRDNNVSYPAKISNFRLDRFEVTVARFRKFVSAVVGGWTPAAGSGKHTHLNGGAGLARSGEVGSEPGWDTAWNTFLPSSKAAWDGASNLGCDATHQTWTANAGGNDTRPINCVNWYQAAAFCIWDQGFLPSEAEWTFAAAGGNQQREYPWSSPPSSTTIDCSFANYSGASGGDYCVLPGTGATSPVGSLSPKGDGLFGQADLSGNVAEWNLDWYASYVTPCSDCAGLMSSGQSRGSRGGSFVNLEGFLLPTSYRDGWSPGTQRVEIGVRCARSP